MPELKNKGNYFGATPDRPYHLSVGAVLVDEKNDVVCLHYPQIDQFKDIYSLTTETMTPNETIETALARGVKEELGYECKLITFLGTIVTSDIWWGELNTPTEMEKTVLFFLLQVVAPSPESVQVEPKGKPRDIVHKPIDELIQYMENAQIKDGMRDFDQLVILKRAQKWVHEHPDLSSPTL